MCTANLIIISIKHGVLLREAHHGDRMYIEHDGEVIADTLPGDIDVNIGTEGRGLKMIAWAKHNLKSLKYVHDFTNKVVNIKAIDMNGNAIHAAYSSEMSFLDFLDYIEKNDIDNLNMRMKCFIRNEDAMKKLVRLLREEYVNAENEEN